MQKIKKEDLFYLLSMAPEIDVNKEKYWYLDIREKKNPIRSIFTDKLVFYIIGNGFI